MDKRVLGERIKEARERKGLTQEQLAEMVDYSPAHMSVVERGLKAPRLEKMIAIANALQCDIDFLLRDELLVMNAMNTAQSSVIWKKISHLPSRKQQAILQALDAIVSVCETDV